MTSRPVRPLTAMALLLVIGCSAGENLAVPEGPSLLEAEAVGMTSVRLRWLKPDADIRSYRIERRTNLSGEFGELAVIPSPTADTIVYFDTTVEPDQIYGYRVSALGNLGRSTDYSVIAGVRTPPRPGIDARIVTIAPSPTVSDADGYVIRIEGPTPLSGAVGVGEEGTPFVRRFAPLEAGDYTVHLDDVAENCRVSNPAEPAQPVSVTDQGIHTIAIAPFEVVCRDPTRGTIEANVTVTGSTTNGQQFQVVTSGLAEDATLPDDQRAYAQTRNVEPGGGLGTFDDVRPGIYEVELRNLGTGCTLQGEAKRGVTLAALDIQRIEYAVECASSGGGDVDDPTKPFKLRSQWSNATPAPGDVVALNLSLFLTDNPPFVLLAVDALTDFSSAVLRADSASPAPGFSVTPNTSVSGRLAWSVITANPAAATGPIPLAQLWFTVVGSQGASTRTATTVNLVADENGEEGDGEGTYASRTQAFPEATLTVGETGGGGTNQRPVAVIAGANPLTGVAGTAVSVSAAGSTDSDGSIVSYAWSFPSGTPSAGTGADASTTYGAAGSYTITLTVTDDDNETATATRSVTVSSSGGGNQAPVAAIAGADPMAAAAGVPVTLSATGSSDPEGGPLTYAWNMPGGAPTSGTASTVTTTYAAAGSYTATLTVTDNQSASATATRTVNVTNPAPSASLVWRNAFGAAGTDGSVAMTVTLDLRPNLTETPGPEQLQSFRADSIDWDSAILEYVSTTFATNINGSATLVSPGRLKLQGSAIGDGPTGLAQLATVNFRVKSGATGSTTTKTYLGRVIGTPATVNFDYLPRTTITEGTHPSSGGGPQPTTGTVTGTVTRAGAGSQSLSGIMVSVDPSASGAPTVSGSVTGTGATLNFSVNVEVGTGTGAGAGSVTLGSLPSGCTVTSPPAGSASYAGLTAGGTQTVALTVTCTNPDPGPSDKYLVQSAWGPVTGGQVDLVISVDPSGFDSPAIAGPDGVGGLQAITRLTGSAAGRFTAVTSLATNGFGPATLGQQPLPEIHWLTNTTQGERTSLADVATLRFTIGAGAAGTVMTATQGILIFNGNGDELPLDDDGDPSNGLGHTAVAEATLEVP